MFVKIYQFHYILLDLLTIITIFKNLMYIFVILYRKLRVLKNNTLIKGNFKVLWVTFF